MRFENITSFGELVRSELSRELLVTIRKSIYINYLQLQLLITHLYSRNRRSHRELFLYVLAILPILTREKFSLYMYVFFQITE